MENRICESCGMPMRHPAEFGGGKTDNLYCRHCTDETGRLKPFDRFIEDLKNFIISRMGIHEEEAMETALANIAKMPAWKDKIKDLKGDRHHENK